jgi:ferritin-like metal-binding protein YciE
MPTDNIRDLFVTGLRNAHAMENEALSIMRPQLKRIENYPAVAQRLDEHIRETEGQIERLGSILNGMGEDNSTLKDTALSIMGSMAAVGHSMAGDEILKNSFANFAFENFEIAAYSSLLVMANAAGAGSDVIDRLEMNLEEEEAMAAWLHENLAATTEQFIQLSQSGQSAKI